MNPSRASHLRNGRGRAASSRTESGDCPGRGALLAAGSGTAMASVCAIGLFHIEQLVGGLWSVAAVGVAGVLCALLARVFTRLSDVVPSGAGLLAYVSRGLGRHTGVVMVAPYLILMLFLVGFEALIMGALLAHLLPIPALIGAMLFLIGTWAVCRAGLRIGYRVQALTTSALFVCLVGLSIAAVIDAASRGDLTVRLLPSVPSPTAFVVAVGQALFLFMGFELLTSHVEVVPTRVVGPALLGSVVVLTIFYAVVSLGFSCLTGLPEARARLFVPQLAIAEQTGSTGVTVLVAAVCVLASFSSFNGALLALSRFIYALAAQGMLPRRLSKMEPRTLTARAALAALLGLALGFTAAIYL